MAAASMKPRRTGGLHPPDAEASVKGGRDKARLLAYGEGTGSIASARARAWRACGHQIAKLAPPAADVPSSQRPLVASTIAFPIARPSPAPPPSAVARWKRSK